MRLHHTRHAVALSPRAAPAAQRQRARHGVGASAPRTPRGAAALRPAHRAARARARVRGNGAPRQTCRCAGRHEDVPRSPDARDRALPPAALTQRLSRPVPERRAWRKSRPTPAGGRGGARGVKLGRFITSPFLGFSRPPAAPLVPNRASNAPPPDGPERGLRPEALSPLRAARTSGHHSFVRFGAARGFDFSAASRRLARPRFARSLRHTGLSGRGLNDGGRSARRRAGGGLSPRARGRTHVARSCLRAPPHLSPRALGFAPVAAALGRATRPAARKRGGEQPVERDVIREGDARRARRGAASARTESGRGETVPRIARRNRRQSDTSARPASAASS